MPEDKPITPNSDEFTEKDVEQICELINGDAKTIRCFFTEDKKQLTAGQFEITLNYKELTSIDAEFKFSAMFKDSMAYTFYETTHEVKARFLCIIMRPQNRNLVISENDSRTGKKIFAYSVPVSTSQYMLLFFHKEEKHELKYEITNKKSRSNTTFFTIMVFDERAVIPFKHALFSKDTDIHLN